MVELAPKEYIKGLIGRPGRLRLAAWILRRSDPEFYQTEATKGTGLVQNEIREVLKDLMQLGLVEEAPREPGAARRQYYRRLPSPAWRVFHAAIQALQELGLAEDDPLLAAPLQAVRQALLYVGPQLD